MKPATRGIHPLALNTEDMRATVGTQHVAFAVTPGSLSAMQQRLRDPNGIRLEACCQPKAKEKPKVIGSVAQKRAEARRELESIEAKWASTTVASGEFS